MNGTLNKFQREYLPLLNLLRTRYHSCKQPLPDSTLDGFLLSFLSPLPIFLYIFYYFLKFKQLVNYSMYSEKKQVLLDKFLILYLIYKFLVVSCLCKHVQNVFYRLICLHTVQGFSHDIDGFLLVLAQQQILSSGS